MSSYFVFLTTIPTVIPITAIAAIVNATNITLNKVDYSLGINETYKLVATVNPDNTTDKTVDQMLDNAVLNSIFMAIGLGLDCNSVVSKAKTPEEAYNIIKQKTRYGKIILSADADSDGSQICNLLLYAFSKYATRSIVITAKKVL